MVILCYLLFLGNRVCGDGHLTSKNLFYLDQLQIMRVHAHFCKVESAELTKLLKHLSVQSDRAITDTIADYSMPEAKLIVFTGLNWEQLIQLRDIFFYMRFVI